MIENDFMIENEISIVKKLRNNYAIVKSKYGNHKIQLKQLNEGHIPTIRSAINKEQWIINKANDVHNSKYKYLDFKYIGIEQKIIAICSKHGKFKTRINHHINKGAGCKYCAIEKNVKIKRDFPSGWSASGWSKLATKSNNFDGFKVYIIECFNDNERFIKIGRTFTTIKRRFITNSGIPYKIKIVKEIFGNSNFIFNLEQELKNNFKFFKYKPNIAFHGMYECFDIKIKNIIIGK